MQSFFYLFTRYLAERAQSKELSVYLPPHTPCFRLTLNCFVDHQCMGPYQVPG